MYSGSENPVTVTQKYSTVFVCDFELTLYPFDDQHCDLHLRVLSASTAYLLFDVDSSTATYLGSELLIEYMVSS